jgi:cold-inducible RNA-binding protein
MSKRIYVGNLSCNTTKESLMQAFAVWGSPAVALVMDDGGRAKGFGFLEIPEDEQARLAIAAMNGKQLDGRTLTVCETRPQVDGFRGAQELVGLPVLAVAEGKRLGSISRILIRREARAVEAVGVDGGAFSSPRYLRFSQLSTIGVDDVMVAGESVLKEGIPPQEIGDLDGSLPGRAVVTEHGQKLGEVVGFTVNTSSGRIESYQVRTETAGLLARLAALVKPNVIEIPDALVLSLGTSALIVREGAALFAPHETGGSAPRRRNDDGPRREM